MVRGGYLYYYRHGHDSGVVERDSDEYGLQQDWKRETLSSKDESVPDARAQNKEGHSLAGWTDGTLQSGYVAPPLAARHDLSVHLCWNGKVVHEFTSHSRATVEVMVRKCTYAHALHPFSLSRR